MEAFRRSDLGRGDEEEKLGVIVGGGHHPQTSSGVESKD